MYLEFLILPQEGEKDETERIRPHGQAEKRPNSTMREKNERKKKKMR